MIADLRPSDFRRTYYYVKAAVSWFAIRCNGLREKSVALRRETQQSVHVTLVCFRVEKNRQSSTAAFALTVARYVLISLLLLFLPWNSFRHNLEGGLLESSTAVCFSSFLCILRKYLIITALMNR